MFYELFRPEFVRNWTVININNNNFHVFLKLIIKNSMITANLTVDMHTCRKRRCVRTRSLDGLTPILIDQLITRMLCRYVCCLLINVLLQLQLGNELFVREIDTEFCRRNRIVFADVTNDWFVCRFCFCFVCLRAK